MLESAAPPYRGMAHDYDGDVLTVLSDVTGTLEGSDTIQPALQIAPH